MVNDIAAEISLKQQTTLTVLRDQLKLTYNKARQAAVTNEILKSLLERKHLKDKAP